MGILSKSQFAKLAGVAPAAITYAIRKGLVVATPDGRVDDTHPTNRLYLDGKKLGVKGAGEGGRKPADGARKIRLPKSLADVAPAEESDDLQSQKLRAEIRLKNEQADRHLQARLERRGVLVEKALVNQMIAKLGAELRTRILDLPRRAGPQLHALVTSGADARAVEEYLERELSDAITRAKTEAKRAGLDAID